MKEQLTLGELIDKLEPIAANQDRVKEKFKEEAYVKFDFGSALPTGLSSWRGVYAELAINYSFNGYGDMVGYKKEDLSTFEPKPPTVTEFLKMIKGAIGKTYTGWKGGDFEMDRDTPLWVSNDGDVGNTAVVDVFNNEFSVILLTEYQIDN